MIKMNRLYFWVLLCIFAPLSCSSVEDDINLDGEVRVMAYDRNDNMVSRDIIDTHDQAIELLREKNSRYGHEDVKIHPFLPITDIDDRQQGSMFRLKNIQEEEGIHNSENDVCQSAIMHAGPILKASTTAYIPYNKGLIGSELMIGYDFDSFKNNYAGWSVVTAFAMKQYVQMIGRTYQDDNVLLDANCSQREVSSPQLESPCNIRPTFLWKSLDEYSPTPVNPERNTDSRLLPERSHSVSTEFDDREIASPSPSFEISQQHAPFAIWPAQRGSMLRETK